MMDCFCTCPVKEFFFIFFKNIFGNLIQNGILTIVICGRIQKGFIHFIWFDWCRNDKIFYFKLLWGSDNLCNDKTKSIIVYVWFDNALYQVVYKMSICLFFYIPHCCSMLFFSVRKQEMTIWSSVSIYFFCNVQ